ncbi:wax ester/triacylglycerol synthase domain-containing protein [Streptosporangium sp. NPDC002607]
MSRQRRIVGSGAAAVRTARVLAPMVGFVARLLPDINVAPRTSLNAPAGTGRRLRVVRLDLEAAREVAHAHGAKVNDLILTIVRGRIVKDRFVAGVRCGRTRLR